MTNQPSLNLDEFSLAKGGLFFKLLVWMRLMRPDLAPAYRRAVVLALFTWLPLLILSAFQGLALGGSVRIPFLFDFPISVRLLLSSPAPDRSRERDRREDPNGCKTLYSIRTGPEE